MKAFEITKDIFIVGGPDITDGRDGCIYLINLGELILIDTGAGWSVDKIINNIQTLGISFKNLRKILLGGLVGGLGTALKFYLVNK